MNPVGDDQAADRAVVSAVRVRVSHPLTGSAWPEKLSRRINPLLVTQEPDGVLLL